MLQLHLVLDGKKMENDIRNAKCSHNILISMFVFVVGDYSSTGYRSLQRIKEDQVIVSDPLIIKFFVGIGTVPDCRAPWLRIHRKVLKLPAVNLDVDSALFTIALYIGIELDCGSHPVMHKS